MIDTFTIKLNNLKDNGQITEEAYTEILARLKFHEKRIRQDELHNIEKYFKSRHIKYDLITTLQLFREFEEYAEFQKKIN